MAFIRTYRAMWDTMPVSRANTALNTASQIVTVNIYDTSAEADVSEIITMLPYGDPLHISTINNDRNKFRVIQAKQAALSVLTDTGRGITLDAFADAADDRYMAEVIVDGETILKGFVMLADNSQAFQPDPNIFTITISDHLGILKDIALTDPDGNNPIGKYRIADLLSFCLLKTGLSLDISVINNLRHIDIDGHFYDKIYLDAKTFEKEIGLSEDCYTVLEKILGHDCCLTQYKGKWFIYRIDEYEGNPFYIAEFSATGALNSIGSGVSLDYSIGADQPVSFSRADQIEQAERPHKFIKLTFNYRSPLEIICNIDFSRGDVITPPDLSAANSTGTYVLDCWRLRNLEGLTITSTCFIQREFEFGYEKQRYAVITPSTLTSTPYDFIESSGVPVREKDRMRISVDFRWPNSFSGGGSTYNPMRVFIISDTGEYWYFWHPSSTDIDDFFWTGPESVEQERLIPFFINLGDDDETQWKTLGFDLPGMPVNGTLFIGLNQMHQGNASGDNSNIYYGNLTLEYSPLINGSFQKYSGQYNEVDRLDGVGYNANIDEEVFISDSPNAIFKGAMFYIGSSLPLFSGTITFASPNAFAIPGNQTGLFQVGQHIILSTAGSNQGDYQITAVIYHIIGDSTEIQVTPGTIITETVTGDISENVFLLTTRWYSAAVFALGPPPSDDYFHFFGFIQAYAVWNQYRLAYRIITGSVLGLSPELQWADLIYKYILTDGHPATINRFFMLLSSDQNRKSNESGNNVIVEILRTDIGKKYDDPLTFKYIS